MMMSTTMMPPPIKRQKQHINPETNKGYNSPFLPLLSGPKRQPRIPKTAAQLRLAPKADSADRSLSRTPEIVSGGTAESTILVDERRPTRKDLVHPPLHRTKQHPLGWVRARRQGRAADPITERQEKKLSKKINLQKQKKRLRSGDARQPRRLEIKKTETT
jgi:hypothetical protein